MIAIRLKWTRPAALACLLALATSGCGLSAELDREGNPERKPTPTQTRAAPPPASASATPEPSPTVPVQQARGCPSSGVRVDAGRVDAAMGLRGMTLTLTNCGKTSRIVNGYPSVRVLDETGAPLTGVHTVEGTDQVSMAPDSPRPEPFKLAPGEAAHAVLYWRMAAEDGTYLRVAPDKGRGTVNIRPQEPLDIGPENTLGTTAWTLPS